MNNLGLATALSSFAIVIVLALRLLVRRAFGPHSAYSLWLLVPASLVALLLPARTALPSTSQLLQDFNAQAAPTLELSQTQSSLTPVEVTPSVTATEAMAPAVGMEFALTPLLAVLWVAGAILAAIWFALRYGKARAAYEPIASTGNDEIAYSANTNVGPAVVGIVRPRIIVPADFDERFSQNERALILDHERAHLRSGDTRINLLVCAMQCAFWFNPLIHWGARVFRQDQEMVRDADVLDISPGQRADYSRALVWAQRDGGGLNPLGCAWISAHPLVARISQLESKPVDLRRRRIGYAGSLALCVSLATGAWAIQTPSVVQLAPSAGLFLAASQYEPARLFQAEAVQIDIKARVNIVVEPRDDVSVQFADGFSTPLALIANRLTLGEPFKGECSALQTAGDSADVVLRVPRSTKLILGNAVDARIAGSPKGRMELSDCSRGYLSASAAPLQAGVNDTARLDFGLITAPAQLVMADQSQLHIASIHADLTLDQLGASQSFIERVHRSVSANVVGASTLTLGSLESQEVKLFVVGASNAEVKSGNLQKLDLKVLGASSATIGASVATAGIAASGPAKVELDSVDQWTISSKPDEKGGLSVNGKAQSP